VDEMVAMTKSFFARTYSPPATAASSIPA
jgi:hypothetical protein